MAPIRRSPPRRHRSRSSAISSPHDSSLVSTYPGLGVSPRARRVISHPASHTPRRISRHHPQAQSYRLPRLSLERHVSSGSYFQGVRRISRVTREALTASDQLQQMLDGGQAQRTVSSREPTRRLASAWNTQQRSQRFPSDEAVEQGPHQLTALDLTPLPSDWDVHEPMYNASQNYLSAWKPTYLASNEAPYGQRQRQQTPERPSHFPRLPCLRLSPVSPCERGPAMSEEQRKCLLCSMPGYQSSSSPTAELTPTAEPTPVAEPTLRQGRLAPVEERRSSTDVGMHDITEDLGFEYLKAWPANGRTLASTGDGGGDWSFLENAVDDSSSASDDWSMNNASSDYQGENPIPHRFQAVLDSVGPRPGRLPRGQGLKENNQDVEVLAQQLQNQRLAEEGNHPT